MLKTDVSFAWAVLYRRCVGPVVSLNGLIELCQINVLDCFTVENDFEPNAAKLDPALVPLERLVNLLGWRDGSIDSAGQFGILGVRVVAQIGELQLHAIKSWVTIHRRSQGDAAVAAFRQLDREFKNEVGIFAFAYEPGATFLAG